MPGFIGSNGKFQALDNNGVPLVGGQVWILEPYSSGFSSLIDSYDDWENAVDAVSPQSNPVVLDSRGEAIIIVNSAVKLVLEGPPPYGQTHGTQIWAIDEVAVANAQNVSSGGYQFLNNTISDVNGNVVATLATEANANSSLSLTAHDSNDPPELKSICSGTTDLDLWIVPQNNGTIVTTNKLKVRMYNASNSNNITFTPTAAGGVPAISIDGTDTNIGCTFATKGTGVLTVNNPVTINGNTNFTGTLTNAGNVAVTGNITATGNATISGTTNAGALNANNTAVTGTFSVSGASTLASVGAGALACTTVSCGAITSSSTLVCSSFIQGTGVKLSNSGFAATINAPTLAANRTWTWPSADGSANQVLTTNGSGTLSFATPTVYAAIVVSAYHNTTQSISNGSGNLVSFNSELFDPSGIFASSRLTPTTAGYYEVSFTGSIPTVGWAVDIYKNGAIYSSSIASVAANQFQQHLSWIVYCNGTTDYIQIAISQSSGGSVTLGTGCQFAARFVGS